MKKVIALLIAVMIMLTVFTGYAKADNPAANPYAPVWTSRDIYVGDHLGFLINNPSPTVYLTPRGHIIAVLQSLDKDTKGDAYIVCIDPDKGTVLWKKPLFWKIADTSTNVFADPKTDMLYLLLFKKWKTGTIPHTNIDEYKTQYEIAGFNLKTETLEWTWQTPNDEEVGLYGFGMPLSTIRPVYGKGIFFDYDLETHDPKGHIIDHFRTQFITTDGWAKFDLQGSASAPICAPLYVNKDGYIVGYNAGTVYIIDPSTGKVVKSYPFQSKDFYDKKNTILVVAPAPLVYPYTDEGAYGKFGIYKQDKMWTDKVGFDILGTLRKVGDHYAILNPYKVVPKPADAKLSMFLAYPNFSFNYYIYETPKYGIFMDSAGYHLNQRVMVFNKKDTSLVWEFATQTYKGDDTHPAVVADNSAVIYKNNMLLITDGEIYMMDVDTGNIAKTLPIKIPNDDTKELLATVSGIFDNGFFMLKWSAKDKNDLGNDKLYLTIYSKPSSTLTVQNSIPGTKIILKDEDGVVWSTNANTPITVRPGTYTITLPKPNAPYMESPSPITVTLKDGENKVVKFNYVKDYEVKLQVNSKEFFVNGKAYTLDSPPVIIPKWGRTVVPIRAIVEALGGTVQWDPAERKVTVALGGHKIALWIGKNKAQKDDFLIIPIDKDPDVKPIIINNRTMLPLRFVAESLGCTVNWDPATKTITLEYKSELGG